MSKKTRPLCKYVFKRIFVKICVLKTFNSAYVGLESAVNTARYLISSKSASDTWPSSPVIMAR